MSNFVRCCSCGKRVSNKCETELIVVAYVQCEECVKKESEALDQEPFWCGICELRMTSCCPTENMKLEKSKNFNFTYQLYPRIAKCDNYKEKIIDENGRKV